MKKINLNIPFEAPRKAQYYITGLLKYLNDEFDQVSTANNLVNKYYDDKSSKYYNMSVQDIISKWSATGQRAIFIGNTMDEYVGMMTEPEKQKFTKLEWAERVNWVNDPAIYHRTNAWKNYWSCLEKGGWEMIGREIPLFYTVNGHTIGGRADMIVYNKRLNNITIIDWKTADKIDKDKFTKLAHGPIANLYQDKATSYGIQVAFYKLALRNILPPELKDVNIDTCIVQLCSSGEIVRTKNNISLTDSELIKLLSWCIDEDDKAKGKTSQPTDVKTPKTPKTPKTLKTPNTLTFETELRYLLNRHCIDTKYNMSDVKLTKYIINTLDALKEVNE